MYSFFSFILPKDCSLIFDRISGGAPVIAAFAIIKDVIWSINFWFDLLSWKKHSDHNWPSALILMPFIGQFATLNKDGKEKGWGYKIKLIQGKSVFDHFIKIEREI